MNPIIKFPIVVKHITRQLPMSATSYSHLYKPKVSLRPAIHKSNCVWAEKNISLIPPPTDHVDGGIPPAGPLPSPGGGRRPCWSRQGLLPTARGAVGNHR